MKSFLLVLDIKAEAGTHKIHVKSPQTEKPVIIFRHGNTGNLHYSVKTLDVNKISLQDKTIYRYPKLVLPRNKVDVLKEKYKILTSIDGANENVIVVKPPMTFSREDADLFVTCFEKALVNDLPLAKLEELGSKTPT